MIFGFTRAVMTLQHENICEKFSLTAWFIWHKRNQRRLSLPSDDFDQVWVRAIA
jgi:hypothetical protein